jgi:8-amino-7-oxononanoate synthase
LSNASLHQRLRERLQERKTQQLWRTRRVLETPQQVNAGVDGKPLLSFCSNDYLGLANHAEVIAAFRRGLDQYGAGSGASHLVTGHSAAHHALEQELAAFTGRSRALLFSSGYMANVGVLTTLLGKSDHAYEDRLNHVSLLDGGLFSGARFSRYPHLDSAALDQRMRRHEHDPAGQGLSFIISDGVFSMDGDVAPLAKLMSVAEQHRALLMIDDAHGFGVLGRNGGGLAEHLREQGERVDEQRLPILVGTLGKAFGTAGAFVTGSDDLIESLIQFCRPYIYTTALPPAIAVATSASLKLVQQQAWRREQLHTLVQRFRRGCAQLGLALTESATPIQGLLLGTAERASAASHALEQRGLLVTAIRPPTVPQGTARLRVNFSATHTEAHVDRLLSELEALRLHASVAS